jgi:hypothetical protein
MKNSELLAAAQKKGLTLGHCDIENSPRNLWAYGDTIHWIDYKQVTVPTMITSIAWVEDKEKTINYDSWDVPKTLKDVYLNHKKDYKMLKRVVPILNKFDVLIGQNLNRFDKKKIQARLCELELPRLDSLLTMDTLTLSKRSMSFDSHKQDARSLKYGFGGKIHQDMQDAIAVAQGHEEKTLERLEYNIKDVSDERNMFHRELDYYNLSQSLILLLKLFINSKEPTWCVKCAKDKKSRFNLRRYTQKNTVTFICNVCDFKWSIRRCLDEE